MSKAKISKPSENKTNEIIKKLFNKSPNELSYKEASEIINKLKNET